MELYSNFIGIDIGKFSFTTNVYNTRKINEYENSSSGIESFLREHQSMLSDALCILETTGGYEMELLLTLCRNEYGVHRGNTRKIKHFIRSYGNDAKTDALDAKALALYGHERYETLELYQSPSPVAMELYELVTRRHDLRQMLVAEKNRLKAPKIRTVKKSCEALIKTLSLEIDSITSDIDELIKSEPALKQKKEILKTVAGIGNIIANDLIALLPELGHVNRREIASLVGVAPKSNDSGIYSGYRSTWHGRAGIKPNLFLAAMAARNSNTSFKAFYGNLISRGKKKKVALTALMRKIIIVANARVKESIKAEAVI